MKKHILFIIFTIGIFWLNAQCVDNGNYWNESWTSCSTSSNPNSMRGNTHWILYEFQEPQYIDSSYVWNANRSGESAMGAKDVVIDYSVDGTSWIELGQYIFPQANESVNYTGFQGPRFNGAFIHKILITVINTHDGGDCASLAEMQFKIDQTACYGTMDICGTCNGPGELTWYIDVDGDGLGNTNSSINACTQPTGYVANNSDECDNGYLGWSDMNLLFENNGCLNCHGAGAASGLDLRTYESTSLGGNICGTNLLTGTTLVDIITIDGYDACGTPITLPAMNARTGNQFDATELATLQAWINGNAPENCADFCPIDYNVNTTYNNGAIIELKTSNQISAQNILEPGSDVIYDAGTQVNLESGFEAKLGAKAHIKVDGCNNNSSVNKDNNTSKN